MLLQVQGKMPPAPGIVACLMRSPAISRKRLLFRSSWIRYCSLVSNCSCNCRMSAQNWGNRGEFSIYRCGEKTDISVTILGRNQQDIVSVTSKNRMISLRWKVIVGEFAEMYKGALMNNNQFTDTVAVIQQSMKLHNADSLWKAWRWIAPLVFQEARVACGSFTWTL
jgi:hypothetical protein